MPHFIVSTCGLSLLTNHNPAYRKLVTDHANAKNPEDIAELEQSTLRDLRDLIDEVEKWIPTASIDDIAKHSAELNLITKFYSNQEKFPSQDYHLLLCTDTWLGEETAKLIQKWLTAQGARSEIKRQRDLQTVDLESFQLALSELVHWCETTLPGWQQNQYKIIFNLTGGFKSVQGFMQALAMFYADETLYMFESAPTLLRIPRLPVPVSIDTVPVVEKHLQTFRRLALGLLLVSMPAKFPETLLMRIKGEAVLSEWGQLVWERGKKEVYPKRIHPPPSSKLQFGPQFMNSTRNCKEDRIAIINQRIDDLARHLERGANVLSLDFKPLRGNPNSPSTHECDAWSDRDARRLYGHFDEDNVFILDKLDRALH